MTPAEAYNLISHLAFQARELTLPQFEIAERHIDGNMARGLSKAEAHYMSMILFLTREYHGQLMGLEWARVARKKIEPPPKETT
jgi:hypothetical protein